MNTGWARSPNTQNAFIEFVFLLLYSMPYFAFGFFFRFQYPFYIVRVHVPLIKAMKYSIKSEFDFTLCNEQLKIVGVSKK